MDQQQAQAQPSSRMPLQSSRNSIRLPNNGGDMSPTKALRTTTSIKLLPENKTRENTLNDDDSPTSTASPDISQIENNLRDRRNLRSNSCQASKDLGARNNSNSPEISRNKKIGQNFYSSRGNHYFEVKMRILNFLKPDHLKKGNSFRETSTSSSSKKNLIVKTNLMVERNTSDTVKKIKEPLTPNKFSKGKESKTNILKFEKEK